MAPSGAAAATGAAAEETKFDKFMKGFYGTLDVLDAFTTKGIDQPSAFHWNYANPLDPGSGLVRGGNKGTAVGASAISRDVDNGSNIGYRGSHKIPKTRILTSSTRCPRPLDIAAAPGLNDTWTKSSNPSLARIGLGDTYIGFKQNAGVRSNSASMYAPYKTSTDRLNPFGGQLGGYNTIMGNTGGDNRVEFGTRFDHAIVYDSPACRASAST